MHPGFRKIRNLDMPKKTEDTPVVKRVRNTSPAINSIEEAAIEEVQAMGLRRARRSELARRLDGLEIGNGLKIDGDFKRVKASVAAFSQKNAKRFNVELNPVGLILVARTVDKEPDYDSSPNGA